MSLIDDFNQLKLGVVGTKTSDINKKLDFAVKDILQYKSNAGRLGYIDLMKNIITKSAASTLSKSSVGNNLFNQVANPAAFGQGQRLGRYKMYESIVSYIGYCQRAMTVIVDNILSPDDITKTSLEINPKKFIDDNTKSMGDISYIKELIDSVKLEKYLDVIVSSTLQNGDFFVEIADQKTALTSRAFLAENMVNLHTNQNLENTSFVFESKEDNINVKIKMDYSLMREDNSDDENTVVNLLKNKDPNADTKPEKKQLKNYTLALHDPSRVVKLQSELYPLCFGYLIFPKFSIAAGINIADQAINDICKNIIDNLATKIPNIEDMDKKDEIKDIISNIIKETSSQTMMTIRFVPPDRMQHFQKPSVKNYPYGQSLFYGTEFNAKVLISLETSLAVQRINRSSEKRKISVEIGLPRDAQKMIQKLKEQFRKRKVSIDSYGSVDTIASSISTFEDIYIPMKDGKPFVDISTFTEGNADIRSKVDELKYMRDSITASLQVPPSFIGIEESLSNKTSLSEENILFARAIVNHQKYLGEQVNEIIQKIVSIIDPEKAMYILDNISVNFSAPKSLQFERQTRYISDLVNLIESLERIGIPKNYSVRKYLTDIDFVDLKNYQTSEDIDKSLGVKKEEPDAMGGFGGGF